MCLRYAASFLSGFSRSRLEGDEGAEQGGHSTAHLCQIERATGKDQLAANSGKGSEVAVAARAVLPNLNGVLIQQS